VKLFTVARRVVYWLLLLVLAGLVFIQFLRNSDIGDNGKATIERTLTGTAYRPYAYRVLLPVTANLLAPLVDGPTALRLGRQSESILGERFFRARLNGRLFPRQVILLLGMMYLSLVGFAVSMWFFLRDLGYGFGLRYALPPLLLLTSLLFSGFGYIYDFTLLCLFTLGLWLMYRQAWGWYLLAFALGTLNKETTILLSLVFVLYFLRRMPRRKFALLLAAQVGLYAVLQGLVRYRFRNSPGGLVEWHLPDQIATFRAIAGSAPWLFAVWAAAIAVIIVLIARGWRRKPEYIRYAMILVPIFLVLFILWGYPLEIRAMLEVLAPVVILMLPPPPARGDAVLRSAKAASSA
jgi:hypothetical protein